MAVSVLSAKSKGQFFCYRSPSSSGGPAASIPNRLSSSGGFNMRHFLTPIFGPTTEPRLGHRSGQHQQCDSKFRCFVQSPDSTGNSGRARTSAGQMTVEGCLGGSDGNFSLTNQNGRSYQLTGHGKLSEHVGHEVTVTGTSGSAGTGASGSTESSTGGQGTPCK